MLDEKLKIVTLKMWGYNKNKSCSALNIVFKLLFKKKMIEIKGFKKGGTHKLVQFFSKKKNTVSGVLPLKC